MKFKFWGTRGSAPVSGPQYVEFGGNTPCLQSLLESTREVLILDSGTGIRELGAHLLANREDHDPVIHLFLTHAHWDHIQGFPFFGPAYVPGYTLNVHCTKLAAEFLQKQMSPPFFPVGLEVMQADIRFHQLEEGQVCKVGGAEISWIPLPHPQESTGFRIDEDGRSLVFATDTEHPENGVNEQLVRFADKASALVYDAQYTPEEYEDGKQGWGHSTFRQGVELAREAGVERLVLFSHDPSHDDAACRAIERAASERFENTWAARQGTTLEI